MCRRSVLAVAVSAIVVFGSGGAGIAQDCSGNPNALGTSRTVRVNPADYPLVGRVQYLETIPLRSREVVLTFDDGPVPPYTNKILDTLAAECVKATFFVLGVNVAEAPDLVRRAHSEGHSIGTHGFSHDDLTKMTFEQAKKDIDLGMEAAAEALGDAAAVSPFFRAPLLEINKKVERYLFSRGQMVWSIDADSADWTLIPEDKMIETAIAELEKAGKGILLMHDIQPVTARALPGLLAELKRRNFRIVHVVPATRPRQKAATLAR